MAGTTLLIAHRGGAVRPDEEHTLTACSRALAYGAHALEVDVRRTADGALVLWHDGALVDATGRSWPVRTTTLAQLRQHWPPLLQLETVLERFGSRTLLVLDLKDPAAVPALAATLTRWPYPDRVLVTSQQSAALRRLSTMVPQIYCGLSRGHAIQHMTRIGAAGGRVGQWALTLQLWFGLRQAGCRILAIQHRLIQPPLIRMAQRSGIAILAWTVDYPAEAQRLTNLGVCGITTNAVQRLAALDIWRYDQPASWRDVLSHPAPRECSAALACCSERGMRDQAEGGHHHGVAADWD